MRLRRVRIRDRWTLRATCSTGAGSTRHPVGSARRTATTTRIAPAAARPGAAADRPAFELETEPSVGKLERNSEMLREPQRRYEAYQRRHRTEAAARKIHSLQWGFRPQGVLHLSAVVAQGVRSVPGSAGVRHGRSRRSPARLSLLTRLSEGGTGIFQRLVPGPITSERYVRGLACTACSSRR